MNGATSEKNDPSPTERSAAFMIILGSSIGAAAVAAIYLIYGAYADTITRRWRRQSMLRKRVAFLLWKTACEVEG
jgi:hypothetical protein